MSIEEAKNKIKEVIYMSDGKKVDYIDINHSDFGGEVSVDIFINAIETLLTTYEKEKEEHKKECHNCDEYTARLGELETENRMLKSKLEKEKEKNKELVEQNEDMKALFNIQASIAKELDFNTNEKMVKFKDEYYVPDTIAINANIGGPKIIELRYISATKYLTKFD